jgi:hypothetical protein
MKHQRRGACRGVQITVPLYGGGGTLSNKTREIEAFGAK